MTQLICHWPHRLLDRDQVEEEEYLEDEEEDEFLKGFKVLRSYIIITSIKREGTSSFYSGTSPFQPTQLFQLPEKRSQGLNS